MTFTRRIALSIFLTGFGYYCFGQQGSKAAGADTVETHLKSSLVSYFKKYPQEKVFVHTNQDVFSGGQTIWYKIYAAAYGRPDALSSIIYVRLTDTAGNLIVQNKLRLVDGRAHGNIAIDPGLKSGWYKLSAFTSWMMNFGPEAYYKQKIYIHNSSDAGYRATSGESNEKRYHIDFYPEGGDLVAGNLTNVAFKAFSDDGMPAPVEGEIKDNTRKTIARLITLHDGMGEFEMEPLAGNSYSATIKFPDGSTQEVKLPEPKTTGISLQVNQGLNTIQLKLAFADPQDKSENCILAAFQNSGLVTTFPLQLLRGINEFQLPKSGFKTGILRLTLFNEKGLPQAERILFINKHDLNVSPLKADTLSFLPHASNSFSTIIKDRDGNPLKGNFSVAVTDGDAFNVSTSQNIFSALLLSPELKGEIYNPGYYFQNESDSLARQLDLVMLSNGWRHFSWQKVLNNERYPLHYPVEQSPYIAGEIAGYKKLPLKGDQFKIKLMIVNQDSSKFVGYIIPDTAGRFIIKDFNHAGVSDIYLETQDRKKHIKKLPIKLFPTLDDSLKRTKANPFREQEVPELTGYYISHGQSDEKYGLSENSIMLKTVSVKEKKTSPTDKLIAEHVSQKYTSEREFTLDLVNNPTVNIGLIDYIRGKFANLQVLGDNTKAQFIYRGGNSLMRADSVPYCYLDEMPVMFESVKDISLNEVAMIRFMPPPVWFAPFNGGGIGALMIYTRKASDEVRRIAGMSDFDHYMFNGFSITREFAPPDYNRLKQAGLIDDRMTLYWNHDIETDNNGVLKFRFNNSDIAKKYNVIIQGMDAQGRLVYLEQGLR